MSSESPRPALRFFPGDLVRLPHLAEDLRLADQHRVEPAGDGEQVLHGARLVVHVKAAVQLLERHPGRTRQHLADLGDAAVEGGRLRVDLDAVAGGEQRPPR